MALDKNPGVRSVGIGEAIRRLMAKLVHTLTTTQAMEACGSNNLCGGLKAGIEGAIHASKRAFGKETPPNVVSSDSHPKGATGLETLWEGGSEPEDSEGEEFPSLMQVWYADDFSTTASGRATRPLMKRLGEIGPSRGVFPVTIHLTSPGQRGICKSRHQWHHSPT